MFSRVERKARAFIVGWNKYRNALTENPFLNRSAAFARRDGSALQRISRKNTETGMASKLAKRTKKYEIDDRCHRSRYRSEN